MVLCCRYTFLIVHNFIGLVLWLCNVLCAYALLRVQVCCEPTNPHHILFQAMTMMFEVQDLAVASPATVSRCGMVYLEPSILGLSPFVRCWLKQLPPIVAPYKEQLEVLFHNFLEPSIKFLRRKLKEFVPTSDGSMTFSLLKLLECFFLPFKPQEVQCSLLCNEVSSM